MKKRSSWMLLLFIVCLLPGLATATPAHAEEQLKLMVEGHYVEPDVPPMIEKGRTLVPLRIVAEELGATVTWDDKLRQATIERDQTKLELTLGRAVARRNGKEIKLDTPPGVHNGRMLLPLRFVSESLGLTVGWDAETRTVVVNTPIRVMINEAAFAGELKAYQIDGKAYLPIEAVAESFGLKQWAGQQTFPQARTIDSIRVASIDAIGQALGIDTNWDQASHHVSLNRETKFSGAQVDGEKLRIETSKRVMPLNFTMQGPHRIVLDFPQTVLSAKLKSQLDNGGQGILYEAAKAQAQSSDPATENRDPADQTSLPEWLFDEGEREADAQSRENTTQNVQTVAEPAKTPLITTIRYSQYQNAPAVVRVVIELSQKSKYQVTVSEEGIELTLNPIPRKTGYLIVVDAGNGGHDNGASGVAGNREKDYNLAVANKVAKLLSQYKEFQVVTTRSTDVYLTLKERADLANEWDADLFLSIHANSFKPTTRGTETFYYNANSEDFARVVHKHLVKATGFPDRTVQIQPFYVIKNTTMPAALTETGFLTNEIENKLLMSPEFQDRIAKALTAAIREYYEQHQ
ncbi:MAG: N-acetylmuramoyl-L-alanine amidase [Clostridia bacterium]